jgi:plastocyanin
VIAAVTAFNTNSIEVTAGQPFTVTLDNQDSVTHNLHIYTQEDGNSIAVTDPESVSPGGTGTLTTTIAQPGEYYFQCDFHPAQMNGTLTVN